MWTYTKAVIYTSQHKLDGANYALAYAMITQPMYNQDNTSVICTTDGEHNCVSGHDERNGDVDHDDDLVQMNT